MSHATGNEDASGTGQGTDNDTYSGADTLNDGTVDNDPNRANLGSLGDAGHTFDQTNGLVDGLEGNANGFAEDNDEGDGTDGGDDSSVPLISPESQ